MSIYPSLLQDLHLQVKMLEVVSQASCCSSYAPDLSNFTLQAAQEPTTLLMYALGKCEATTARAAGPNTGSFSGASF